MPILTNERREKFAQGMASGQTGADSARAAGYKESRCYTTASVLNSNAKVRDRIAELRVQAGALAAQTVSYTLIDALNEANLAFEMSRSRKNGAAMSTAVALKAKLCGLLVEKTQEVRSMQELSDVELDKLVASIETRKAIHVAAAPGIEPKAEFVADSPEESES